MNNKFSDHVFFMCSDCFDSFTLLARAFRFHYYSKNRIYLILCMTNQKIENQLWNFGVLIGVMTCLTIARILYYEYILTKQCEWLFKQLLKFNANYWYEHICTVWLCVSLTEILFIVRACQLLNCSLSVSYKCYWHI